MICTNRAYPNKFILFCFVVALIAMAVALLFQNIGAQFFTPVRAAPLALQAGDLSVVGQPTLPATTVDAIFRRVGSPMAGAGQVVVQASHQANIDDAFALAVWWNETSDGEAGVGLADRNPGGVRGSAGYPSAFDGYTIYPSYSVAIVDWFNLIRSRYVDRGLSTVYAISHPYVGTSSSPLWAAKVVALMLKYRGEAPPLASPTVAPSPTVPVSLQRYYKFITSQALEDDSSTTSLAHQGQPNKTSNQSANATQQTPPALPLAIEYIFVVFALLLALAIAAWAFRLNNRIPAQNVDAPHTDALFVTALDANIPNTESLPHIPVLSPDTLTVTDDCPSPQGTRANLGRFRIILLPSGGAATANTPGSRPTGLLHRYADRGQE